ncbi:sigma factor-like helix-turn-helix DNA-binding protein [Streptomyces chengmaiensis]|uniref:sigma factor-like helix-turn-helix DNA-binding protein n=1 Tax=Streptomyces chengmaiensis TaxID=3040919 RepID=UPI002962547B|nr:sigma factor-like helix-turn-helix DNA-binding protein [Streptomyces chengmaiensis]
MHQAYLLTGRRRLSQEAVERAFHHAWQHWAEVARDRDPAGWVRAVAYDHALSPWHRLRPTHRHPDAPPVEHDRRALLDVLLSLPPSYRRTLLLYDGLGLDLPETAAETEASTPAAARRLLHAREAVAVRLPELADAGGLQKRLAALVGSGPAMAPSPARAVRTGGERRARLWTRAAIVVTTLLIGVTAVAAITSPGEYRAPVAPGRPVDGVPPAAGPEKLSDGNEALRDRLRSGPAAGPGRLLPQLR